MCGNASFDSWNHIQGPIQLYIWGYWCHFLLNPPYFEAEVGWLFILHASLGLSRYLHQLCAFDLRVKQLAGPWLTVFINRPLVSLMNCSVPERLLMPFLWVPAVHVGGLFYGTVLESPSVCNVSTWVIVVSFSVRIHYYDGKLGAQIFSDFLLCQALLRTITRFPRLKWTLIRVQK